jgi:hypothetical protein
MHNHTNILAPQNLFSAPDGTQQLGVHGTAKASKREGSAKDQQRENDSTPQYTYGPAEKVVNLCRVCAWFALCSRCMLPRAQATREANKQKYNEYLSNQSAHRVATSPQRAATGDVTQRAAGLSPQRAGASPQRTATSSKARNLPALATAPELPTTARAVSAGYAKPSVLPVINAVRNAEVTRLQQNEKKQFTRISTHSPPSFSLPLSPSLSCRQQSTT